ncbi:MAG: pyridoxal phosphate-dependent aminotransferase [Clostridia bacterium]|nr:pyridoxal phosphate-dependent aminotransferase [Clostridia bacterium]
MISDKMVDLVKNGSAIRAMFEDGQKMAAIYGAENVYDFSLGNPNVAPPEAVNQTIIDIVEKNEKRLHAYMSNAGFEDVRDQVSKSLNRRFDTHFEAENIIMTVGAAGGLNVVFRALLNPDDEVLTFAPYFGEYRSYVANYNGKLIAIEPDTTTFQPDLKKFEQAITAKTKAVLINTPNNPTGVVYSEETIKSLAKIMEEKQKEFHTHIYLISDEPYRELAYDGVFVPYLTKYYQNTIVDYSFSKSLSLPGERIGYLVIPKEIDDYEMVLGACNVANRILGYVNAPSLMQLVVGACIDEQTDVAYYDRNRELIYRELINMGYECIKPQGAFYLFIKSPIEDDKEFCKMAKNYHLLIVPGSNFGCPGFIRLAYCVSYETIVNSLPKFKELAQEVGISK